MMLAILLPAILLTGAFSIDFINMLRQKSEIQTALDTSNIALARYMRSSANLDVLSAEEFEKKSVSYGQSFYKQHLRTVNYDHAPLFVKIPTKESPDLLFMVTLVYRPFFQPLMDFLGVKKQLYSMNLQSRIRTENTVEVAFVFDNSGSMYTKGKGTNVQRIELLKKAANQLVQIIHRKGLNAHYTEKPNQVALVPFSTLVNIGSENEHQSWMDRDGRSPIHHDVFSWPVIFNENKKIEEVDGVYRKTGFGWPEKERNSIVTRLSVMKDMKDENYRNGNRKGIQWQGCVEARPPPHNVLDTLPDSNKPETLFVPSFVADVKGDADIFKPDEFNHYDYWRDGYPPDSRKYFSPGRFDRATIWGPNYNCFNSPITPLTNISLKSGLSKITSAIENLRIGSNTDITEGLAWGWRVLSNTLPFNEGLPYNTPGNEKIIILLTDGQNTYSYHGSHGWINDEPHPEQVDKKNIKLVIPQEMRSPNMNSRFLAGKQYRKSKGLMDFKQDSREEGEMDNQLYFLCGEIKKKNIKLITISLDLGPHNRDTIYLLKECASESNKRRDLDDPKKMKKMYWNSTGDSLEDDFKEIGDEIADLRLAG